MSKTHLQTAHEYGVKQALQQLGYTSVEDVTKQAAELGLVEDSAKTAAAPENVDAVFAELSKKLAK